MKHDPDALLDFVREIALALPQVEEGEAFGKPAFRVQGKFMARMRGDDATLAIKTDPHERELLVESNPTVYFTTGRETMYNCVHVRLEAIDAEELAYLFRRAWWLSAPKAVLKRDGWRV